MKSNKTMIWATSIIGVVLYFLLLLYFRFLLTAQGAGFFPKLVQEFLFNLPVLLINIFLIFKVVRLFNRFFPSKIYLRLVVEIFAIFFITALLVFATGVLL
ncbi:MAG: hypothetical protein AAF634_13110, partial [Bacteroidota bacterium]